MATLQEQLKQDGFSEDFVPELTDSWFKTKDELKGSISYVFKIIPHANGEVKIFTYTDWHHPHKTLVEAPTKFTKKDFAWLEAKSKEHARLVDELKQLAYDLGKIEAQKIWDQSVAPIKPPQYLVAKGLNHTKDYRVDAETEQTVIVPIYAPDGEICSLQFIPPAGRKYNLPNGRTEGCYSLIDGAGEVAYETEGFATAISVHQATGGSKVFIALNAMNIPLATQSILNKVEQKYVVIAADNDKHNPQNPGLTKAFQTAKKYGLLVKYPTFKEYKEKETTDFDDLRREDGIDECARQLSLTEQERAKYNDIPEMVPLGLKGQTYFFTSTQNPDIQSFTSFPKETLWKIIDKKYWENRFGEMNPITGAITVDWDMVVSTIIKECQHKGTYDEENIRGTGIYIDQGRHIFHLGKKIYEDGKRKKFYAIESKSTYVPREDVPEIHAVPLEDHEIEPIWDSFDLTNLTYKEKKRYLLGWVVCGILSGCLEWRPHIYLTGPRGAGKTQVLEFLTRILREAFDVVHMPAVHSTSVGLRQALQNKSVPSIIDEVEGETQKSKKRSEEIIQFCRIASSKSEAKVLLGTQGQNSKKISISTCALLAGINPQVKLAADLSRFTFIEINIDKSVSSEVRAKNWKHVKALWTNVNQEWSRRFVSRIVNNLDTILYNITAFREHLGTSQLGLDTREADQNGTLIAASVIWEHTRRLTENEMNELTKLVGVVKEGEIVRNTQEEACLKFILETYLMDEGGQKTTIIAELSKTDQSEYVKKQMQDFGVTLIKKRGGELGVNIRQTSHIDARLKDSPYADGYLATLGHIPKAIQNHKIRGGSRGVFIPMNQCIGEIASPEDDSATQF